jgi:hypothetical protein
MHERDDVVGRASDGYGDRPDLLDPRRLGVDRAGVVVGAKDPAEPSWSVESGHYVCNATTRGGSTV